MITAAEALGLFFQLAMYSHAEGSCDGADGHSASVAVFESRRDRSLARRERVDSQCLEYLCLPSSGGGFLLASLSSPEAFSSALEGLTISRPVWKAARRVLTGLSWTGIQRHLGMPGLTVRVPTALLSANKDYSLLSGVPGGGQKIIVRETDRSGQLIAVWKLGREGLPAQLVAAEERALRWLAACGAAGSLAPSLFESGSTRALSWIRMEVLGGGRPGNDLDETSERFLHDLRALGRNSQPIAGSACQIGYRR